MHAVAHAILATDAGGELFGNVLRDTIDQLLDGQHTGRWDWQTLRKTEKTHMGTLVEINLHKAFDFDDGDSMDYRIAGVDVDCKFSQSLGGWELPPESVGHICLVVTANDDAARWQAGLVRVTDRVLRGGSNRDGKRRLTPEGESEILWLYEDPALPENLLLTLDDATRERIFSRRTAADRESGQARINELFRLVQGKIIGRSVVLTVAMQDDSMKRPRDARLSRHLGSEGILVLGHQDDDPRVAGALGLPVPSKGEFVSARVTPAEPGCTARVADIGPGRYRVALTEDQPAPAPPMRRTNSDRDA